MAAIRNQIVAGKTEQYYEREKSGARYPDLHNLVSNFATKGFIQKSWDRIHPIVNTKTDHKPRQKN